MAGESKIAEVSLFAGKVLVMFGDGMMALLEPGQLRHFAQLKPIPKGPLDSD
jgi:hypothetical protein